MKNKGLFIKISALAISIALVYFLYSTVKFNNLSSDIEYFDTDINSEAKFIGVIDDKYYYLEGSKFIGHDVEKELFSIEVDDVNNIIYDKNIYIVENNGKISMIDRYDAKEKKSIDIEKNIEFSRFEDNKIYLFTKDSVLVKSSKLKDLESFENLNNPIDLAYTKDINSMIEMKLKDGIISSKISSNSTKDDFKIETANEIFLDTFIIQNSTYFVSNRYIYKIDEGNISKKIMLANISNIDNDDEKIVVVDNGILKIYNPNLELLDSKIVDITANDLSIRLDSIIILGEDKLKVYQNSNVIESPLGDYISYVENEDSYYVISENKIEKINAY